MTLLRGGAPTAQSGTPQKNIAGYRERGFYVIKHTDNIMPILDRLVAARPHALHSLDPQGGVDMAEVKRRVGNYGA